MGFERLKKIEGQLEDALKRIKRLEDALGGITEENPEDIPEETPERSLELTSEVLDSKISELLYEIGIPANIMGFRYLKTEISMVVKDRDIIGMITKVLYPETAKIHGTIPSRVERATRHAIEIAWGRGDMKVIEKIFKNTVDPNKGKPTNSEFIAMCAEEIMRNCNK